MAVLTFLVSSFIPIGVIVLFTSTLSRPEPLCWVRFYPLTVAPCFHRCRFCGSSADLHCYYGFVRFLTTHRSDFPERLYLRLPLPLQLYSLTQKHVGFEFSIREDVIRPPSVAQESIRNHPCHDHPNNHFLLKLPFESGMSHHTEATSGLLAVRGCGFRYLGTPHDASQHRTSRSPNKKERLPAPTLLRTVHETFASYGSSVL